MLRRQFVDRDVHVGFLLGREGRGVEVGVLLIHNDSILGIRTGSTAACGVPGSLYGCPIPVCVGWGLDVAAMICALELGQEDLRAELLGAARVLDHAFGVRDLIGVREEVASRCADVP